MKIVFIRILIPVVIVSIGIIYYNLSPSETTWMPKCPWWLLTNTYCPSCGVQRFVHLLLNGAVLEALRLNPFLLIVLPYALLAIIGKWYNFYGSLDRLNRFLYSRFVLLTYVYLFFAWWLIRIIFDI